MRVRFRYSRWYVVLLLGALLPAIAGCREPDLVVPEASQVEAFYTYEGDLSVEMSGNVAEITVSQDPDELRRGGALWAKVGPYVVLFSRETRDLFEEFSGLAGVRVITHNSWGDEVARAFMTRDALNELTWRRALNIAGHARQEGTRQPRRLEDLVDWGEEHTEYRYDPDYVPTR